MDNIDTLLERAGIRHTAIEELAVGEDIYYVSGDGFNLTVKSGRLLEVKISRSRLPEYIVEHRSSYDKKSERITNAWVSNSRELAQIVSLQLQICDLRARVISDCHLIKKMKQERDEIKSNQLIEKLAELK